VGRGGKRSAIAPPITISPPERRPARFGWLVMVVSLWIGLGVAVVGVVPALVPAAAKLALSAVATDAINTYGVSWLQRRTDPAMQGRVMSLVMLASMGRTPVAYAISGALADASPTLLFVLRRDDGRDRRLRRAQPVGALALNRRQRPAEPVRLPGRRGVPSQLTGTVEPAHSFNGQSESTKSAYQALPEAEP
jgi:hypothetical protein